jgi:hypothetical protein
MHLSPGQYELRPDAKARLDPTGAIINANAIALLCRRLLKRERDTSKRT